MSAPGRADRVALIACVLATILLLVMLGRVAQLQLSPGERLGAHMHERVARRIVPAARGDISDRRGRVIATTRFGYRVFVDPARFPDPPDGAIGRLADALGVPAEELGERIVSRMAANDRRLREAREGEGTMARDARAGQGRLWGLLAGPRGAAPGSERDGGSSAGGGPSLIRYLRVSDVLDDATVAAVRDLGIKGVHLELRSVREYPAGDLVASLLGKVDIDHKGSLGSELTNEEALSGRSGRVLYVRDAKGRPLWMGEGTYTPPVPGAPLRASIDLELQRMAMEELSRGVEDAGAAGGRLVMLDPSTGEVVAMVDIVRDLAGLAEFPWESRQGPRTALPGGVRYATASRDESRALDPAMARNRCVEDVYEPGSTFKTFVWAAITDMGLARPEEVFDTEGGSWRTAYGRPIRDVARASTMRWDEVLMNSSNIGMCKGAERMTHQQLHDFVRRLGFGTRTGLGLPGEASGIVTSRRAWSRYTQTSVAFGHEIAVTPVQMVRAFAVFARGGELAGTLPPIRLTAVEEDDPALSIVHRVIGARTALLTRWTLRTVAERVEQRMARKGETGWRYTMFGKSGTAEIPLGRPPPGMRRPRGAGYYQDQYNSSFIAAGPVEHPQLVVLVVIDDPAPELVRRREHYGSHVAGPVVRRVLERGLAYLGAAPSPTSIAGR